MIRAGPVGLAGRRIVAAIPFVAYACGAGSAVARRHIEMSSSSSRATSITQPAAGTQQAARTVRGEKNLLNKQETALVLHGGFTGWIGARAVHLPA